MVEETRGRNLENNRKQDRRSGEFILYFKRSKCLIKRSLGQGKRSHCQMQIGRHWFRQAWWTDRLKQKKWKSLSYEQRRRKSYDAGKNRNRGGHHEEKKIRQKLKPLQVIRAYSQSDLSIKSLNLKNWETKYCWNLKYMAVP